MMMTIAQRRTARGNGRKRVFCADDNPLVTEALKMQIESAPDFRWVGCAENADDLLTDAAAIADQDDCPDIVLLDIDMPGRDPFEAIGELQRICPNARVLMYSGLVRRDWIERAMEAGAWGYVSKSDGEQALLAAMRAALADEFALSPEVQKALAG
jgi:DNA-binding NarL/FixJ family response regulator